MKQSYIYFLNNLQNHRYFDAHIGFPKIEASLWCMWAFDNDGCIYLPSAHQWDSDNLGSRLFERAKHEVIQ